MALTTARISSSRWRPPGLGGGIKSLIRSHSASVRSVGYGVVVIPPVYRTGATYGRLFKQPLRVVKSSHALRRNSRCTWRTRESAQNVYRTAIHRAFSPWRPGGSILQTSTTAPEAWHRQAPSRAQGHPGGDTREAQRRHRCTCLGRRARPLLLFSPPGYGLSTLEARWK